MLFSLKTSVDADDGEVTYLLRIRNLKLPV